MTLRTFLKLRNAILAVFMIVILVGGCFATWKKIDNRNDLKKQHTEITYTTEEYECIGVERAVTENYNSEKQEHITSTLKNVNTGDEKTISLELVQGERYIQYSAKIRIPFETKEPSNSMIYHMDSDYNVSLEEFNGKVKEKIDYVINRDVDLINLLIGLCGVLATFVFMIAILIPLKKVFDMAERRF